MNTTPISINVQTNGLSAATPQLSAFFDLLKKGVAGYLQLAGPFDKSVKNTVDNAVKGLQTLQKTAKDTAAAKPADPSKSTPAAGGGGGSVDQFGKMTDQLDQKWGSWTKEAADAFSSAFTSSVETISTGLTALVEHTKTWQKAWHDVGAAITNSVITAFVKMGVQYIVTKTLMMAIDSVAGDKSRQESARTTAASLPGGLSKAGEQGGWYGLLAYIAIFAAGLALISQLSANGRAAGGSVTAGMPYIVGEKQPELFVPGQSGFIHPSVPTTVDLPARNPSPGAANLSPQTHVHFAGIMDSEALAIKGLSGKAGRKFLLDFNKGSVREVTGRG